MRRKVSNLLFLLNDILLIFYMGYLGCGVMTPGIEKIVPFLIVSVILTDITYINICNVKENKVVLLFCGLLALDCWYMLLLTDAEKSAAFLFAALCPCIWYVSILFILLFLFQGGGYRCRRMANSILAVACISVLVGLWVSERAFNSLYGLQLCINTFILFLVMAGNYKRVAFIVKSEKKYLLLSAMIVVIAFLGYYFVTAGIEEHIANFGIYLPVLMFFINIHGIVWKEHNSVPLSSIFRTRQIVGMIVCAMAVSGVIVIMTDAGFMGMLIAINVLFALFYLCNMVWEEWLKSKKLSGSGFVRESKYHMALQWLGQEEALKTEFANFLHDDVLQDLLSIKNIMDKADRPEIREFIAVTLDNLNIRIRRQMQDYHPVFLKKLTMKENLYHLIEDVSLSFPQRTIKSTFDCPDDFFLVEPYNMLIYRLLKELLTNIYKHSDGSRAWITLRLEKNVIHLNVSDNGTGDFAAIALADETGHKGIISVKEQVERMGGSVRITGSMPQGVCIQLRIPMKGDVSYQYFISG